MVNDLSAAARRERIDMRWVMADHLHLTLKFLGESPDEKLPEIRKALDQAACGIAPFPIRFGGLGTFPEKGTPRVIWVGLLEGEEQLALLAKQVESLFDPLGFPRENRPFSAHLTLGRVKVAKNPAKARALIEMIKIESLGRMDANEAALYQSMLSPKGPTYTILHASPFA